MLSDFILQSTNAPGTGAACLLIAPPTGRIAFSAKFTNGASVFYCLDDGTQAEWGIGTLATGSPDTLTRATVIGNTAGTTSRLNFSGITRIYNEVPGENLVYRDSTSVIKTGIIQATEPGTGVQTISIFSPSSVSGANLALLGNGPTTPNKYLRASNGTFQIVNSGYTAAVLTLTDTGALTVTGPMTATSYTVAATGTGSASLFTGGGANTGYLALFNPAGVRQGYVGFGGSGGPLQLVVDGSPGTSTGWNTNSNFTVGGALTSATSATTTASVSGVLTAGTVNTTTGFTGALTATNCVVTNNSSVGQWLFGNSANFVANVSVAKTVSATTLEIGQNITTNGGRVRALYGVRSGPAVGLPGNVIGQQDGNTCPILSDFTESDGNKGYIILPTGLIMQWGQITNLNGTAQNVGLLTSYAGWFNVFISMTSATSGNPPTAQFTGSLSQFSAVIVGEPVGRTANWFTIGK